MLRDTLMYVHVNKLYLHLGVLIDSRNEMAVRSGQIL